MGRRSISLTRVARGRGLMVGLLDGCCGGGSRSLTRLKVFFVCTTGVSCTGFRGITLKGRVAAGGIDCFETTGAPIRTGFAVKAAGTSANSDGGGSFGGGEFTGLLGASGRGAERNC